jgi:DNA replication protein DnaC
MAKTAPKSIAPSVLRSPSRDGTEGGSKAPSVDERTGQPDRGAAGRGAPLVPELASGLAPPEEFTEASWRCARCRDTGWVEEEADEHGYTRARPCTCRTERAREAALQEAGIPPRFARCTLDNFKTAGLSEDVRSALQASRGFVKRFPMKKGLLFMGSPGVGKTHLAAAILNQLHETFGLRVRFEDFSELLARIRRSYDPRAEALPHEQEILAPVYDAEVLLLDDLGASRLSEWARDMLYLVVNTRYTQGRLTLATTNFMDAPPRRARPSSKRAPSDPIESDTLEERVGPRIRSRLYEMCMVVRMQGDDYRRRKK